MSEPISTSLDRREFMQAGGLAAAAAALPQAKVQDAPKKVEAVPRRRLGKTGVDVTMINQGTWRTTGMDRLMRLSYASGVRTYDTAAAYGSEPNFKKWFEENPEVRKSIFLVSKTQARSLEQFIADIDKRIEATGTDHLDLYFWHAMGDHGEASDFPKSKEFAKAVEAIKKTGKAKFVGFSTHNVRKAELITSAAEGGFLDVIMLQYSPFVEKDSPINKALDAAHKAGIGLISMKQFAGQFGGGRRGGGAANRQASPIQQAAEKLVPVLKERKLTAHQGLLHAIWTDERIATSCVTMNNTDQVRENIDAARRFEPLNLAELEQIRNAALAANPTMCANCEGQCALAGGTNARLGDMMRYLTYHEHHGYRSEVRDHYRALSLEERDWGGADLKAAQQACPNKIDFAQLLPEVEYKLA